MALPTYWWFQDSETAKPVSELKQHLAAASPNAIFRVVPVAASKKGGPVKLLLYVLEPGEVQAQSHGINDSHVCPPDC